LILEDHEETQRLSLEEIPRQEQDTKLTSVLFTVLGKDNERWLFKN